ncbi:retinoblastoma-related protein 1 isoform X1 [Lycium barbarum]|uniref:retinoblastoma-related protein 1 isoform X1 n=1 Tax=Lycium barbarum TaxID=112863 RepID=UPI00293EA627|nr:retinoblastoma-related protein 1 isoform X1 [Lycium barbarum]
MEELNNKSCNSGDVDTLQVRFTDFCKNGLSIGESFMTEAIKLFKDSKHLLLSNNAAIGAITQEEVERYWFAFVLFSVKRLSANEAGNSSNGNEGNGFDLCQILRGAKLNVLDFFKELPQFIVKVGPILSNLYGSDWEKRLQAKELQTNFVHLSLLSKYYKRAYQELFLCSGSNEDKNPATANATILLPQYYRFGWLLFLSLRENVFSRFKDLVTCTNGLVSVLAILIIHVPVRFRNFSINDSPRFVKKGDKVDLLVSLSSIYQTSIDDLRETMDKVNNLIIGKLKKKPCLASECRVENLDNIDTDGLTYFEDLMEESSLSSSISILEKDYNDAIQNKGELDERIFINEEDSLLGSGSLSGGAVNMNGVKKKFDAMASPTKTITSPLSPYRSPNCGNSKMAATPVSTAMTTARWLRTVIAPLQPKPSAELERFLSACDRNVSADVIRRAHIILEAIFPSSGPGEHYAAGSLQSTCLMDNIWAEQRRSEALKLYYRVLQTMCVAESQILHATNLTSLLTNERFHRCMLACSAELVLATHKTVTMLFPAVLERTGITSFDLSKVIESFIRHEESLPRELRRHLNSLEERLLESMVWEKGSSMYNSLTVAKPSFSAEINRQGLLAEPMPSLDAIAMHINPSSASLPPVPSLQKHDFAPNGHIGDIRSPKRLCTEYRSVLVERNSFTSPVKDRFLALTNIKSKFPPPPLQSAFASPTRPNPGGGGETCAETSINVFFGKIVKLAAVRINGLIERLQLSQQIRETVYCLFQKILSQRTSLFFNRHIDQIILCSFYGVAKISQLNLTFKEIIYNYRKQPQCKPQVFRSVFVDWSSARHNGRTGSDHVDIITFYNEMFIPSVKPLLVELAPAGNEQKNNHVEKTKNEGQGPASPRPSVFPSLPDMSPKKVSAVHNVYVSPLRSSKMDALISHSSKSYYACVGESTHAYQSPSKDLTVINNRLNGNRKLRGALNFDDVESAGLVSDSIVANSLYLQNGNCISSPRSAVKTEQPDT